MDSHFPSWSVSEHCRGQRPVQTNPSSFVSLNLPPNQVCRFVGFLQLWLLLQNVTLVVRTRVLYTHEGIRTLLRILKSDCGLQGWAYLYWVSILYRLSSQWSSYFARTLGLSFSQGLGFIIYNCSIRSTRKDKLLLTFSKYHQLWIQ